MRLDYDPSKGPHVNVTDFRCNKGSQGITIAIPFDGNEEAVDNLLKGMNTLASLEQAKLVFQKNESTQDLARVIIALDQIKKTT